MSEEDAAKETMDKREKKVKREETIVLKDPYWVGQDVRGKYKVLKDVINIGQKRVILRLFDAVTHRIMARINLGFRAINGEFLGWDMMTDYPVTLRQVGQEAVLSLHKSQLPFCDGKTKGTEEIRLTIECPY